MSDQLSKRRRGSLPDGAASFFGVPKDTWVIFTIRTINSVGYSATLPFLGVYLLTVRDVPLTEIGLIYLITGVLGMASQVMSGRLVDSLGPKKVMLLGYSSSLISSLILGLLVLVNASVLSFFILYPVFSLFRGISQPATAAIIAAQRSSQIRTGFSFLSIGGNLGFAIGPAVAGLIIDYAGYSTAFLLSAATAATVGIIALIWIEGGAETSKGEVAHAVKRWLSWREDKTMIFFLILVFCMTLAINYQVTPMSLYVRQFFSFSNTQIGYLFATNGIVIVILQLPVTRLIEKSSKLLMLPLVFSAGLATASFVVAAYAKTFPQWELFMFVVTLAEITLSVPSQSIVALFSRRGNRGTYQGYYSAFSNSGRSIASFIGPTSFALFTFDPQLSWFAIAAFSLGTGVALAALSPAIQRDHEKLRLRSSV